MLAEKYGKAANGRAVGIVVMVCGVLIGGTLFVFLTKSRDAYKVAQTWPQIEATVVESKIVEVAERVRVGRRTLPTTEYDHQWKATYEFDGKPYTHGSHWTYLSEREAIKGVRKREVGSTIQLYVNPDNPLDIAMHRTSENDPMAGLKLGGILFLFGLIQFGLNHRKMMKIKAQVRQTRQPRRHDHWESSTDAPRRPEVQLETARYFDTAAR